MSRTYKDKYYGAWYRAKVWEDDELSTEDWLHMGAGDYSNRRRMIMKRTNKKLRQYKGEIGQGGWYRRPFGDMWDLD